MKLIQLDPKYQNLAHLYSYYVIYGRIPHEGFLPFSVDCEQDEFDGIIKDIHLDNKWVNKLNKIPNIEILSSCEGHGRLILTHIIFKIKNEDEVENIYSRLINLPIQLKHTKIGMFKISIGICCCLTIYNWYREHSDNHFWKYWWENIIDHIEFAVK